MTGRSRPCICAASWSGGTSGSGVILLSLLMAAGLEGAAVIATDAVISVATSIIKISVFGFAGVITAQVLAISIPRRVSGASLCRTNAGAYSHRDPRCRGDRGWRGDDFVGTAKFALEN